jgi:hypothetical protein
VQCRSTRLQQFDGQWKYSCQGADWPAKAIAVGKRLHATGSICRQSVSYVVIESALHGVVLWFWIM